MKLPMLTHPQEIPLLVKSDDGQIHRTQSSRDLWNEIYLRGFLADADANITDAMEDALMTQGKRQLRSF